MLLKPGAVIAGLHPVMRKPLKVAERIWKANGISEGITITAGLDGVHTASSWHYCGCAVDLRTRYFSETSLAVVISQLKQKLPGYDIVTHSSHIHIEPGDALAKDWGLMQ